MRSSITLKLFLAILATCIVVALAMGMAVRYSFDSGFDDYIRERENQRLDSLALTLAADYVETGGWGFLAGRGDRWERSLRLSRYARPGDRDRDPRGAPPGPPPPVTLGAPGGGTKNKTARSGMGA